jgi:putative tricarboxylic transport membrane protein
LIQRAMRDSDVLAGGVLAALGVYIIMQANRWEYMGFDGPGPGFFPLWYGLAITILSLWLVMARVLKLRRDGAGGVDWSGVGRALGTWALFSASVAVMPWLGFVISFALLTLVLVRVQFARTWRRALFTAIGLSVGFYVLFPLLLDVPLPAGKLGF